MDGTLRRGYLPPSRENRVWERHLQIVIADQRKLVCDSVQLIASAIPGVTVMGQAQDMDGALKLVGGTNGPLTLICGVQVGGGDVVALLRRCRQSGALPRTVVLITPGEMNYAREALRAGASAVCLLDEVFQRLPQILSSQGDGIVSMPAALMARILADPADRLTKREHEIMALLKEGLTTFQVSARLGLSENTVKYYLKAIYQKLDVSTRAAAIAKYLTEDY